MCVIGFVCTERKDVSAVYALLKYFENILALPESSCTNDEALLSLHNVGIFHLLVIWLVYEYKRLGYSKDSPSSFSSYSLLDIRRVETQIFRASRYRDFVTFVLVAQLSEK